MIYEYGTNPPTERGGRGSESSRVRSIEREFERESSSCKTEKCLYGWDGFVDLGDLGFSNLGPPFPAYRRYIQRKNVGTVLLHGGGGGGGGGGRKRGRLSSFPSLNQPFGPVPSEFY